MKYTSEHPAENLEELLDYLEERPSTDKFLYRGQNREYSGPLLPSIYRKYRPTGAVYTHVDDEFRWALRGYGRQFIGLDPVAGWLGISQANLDRVSGKKFNEVTNRAVQAVLMDPRADVAAGTGGVGALLRNKLGPDVDGLITDLEPCMMELLDTLHRRYIRDVVFSIPLGRLLGTAVAQQYGLSSGYLDVSTSPSVAGFFAAIRGPKFNASIYGDELGIIYCFPREGFEVHTKPAAMINSEELFPQEVVLENIVGPFESSNSDFAEVLGYYVEYAIDALETGDPVWEALSLPRGWFEFSRMGRQKAAVLIPNRIVNPHSDNPEPMKLGANPIVPSLFAVENLSARTGVEKYYFRHRGNVPERLGLTREFLWPRNADFFLMVTKSLLILGPDVAIFPHTGYPHSNVPKREDLLDPGYLMNEED